MTDDRFTLLLPVLPYSLTRLSGAALLDAGETEVVSVASYGADGMKKWHKGRVEAPKAANENHDGQDRAGQTLSPVTSMLLLTWLFWHIGTISHAKLVMSQWYFDCHLLLIDCASESPSKTASCESCQSGLNKDSIRQWSTHLLAW